MPGVKILLANCAVVEVVVDFANLNCIYIVISASHTVDGVFVHLADRQKLF